MSCLLHRLLYLRHARFRSYILLVYIIGIYYWYLYSVKIVVGMKNTISIIFGGWNTHFQNMCVSWKIIVGMKNTISIIFGGWNTHWKKIEAGTKKAKNKKVVISCLEVHIAWIWYKITYLWYNIGYLIYIKRHIKNRY